VNTTKPCDKLDYQLLGPFMISDKINDVGFQLQLPRQMNLHRMLHVSLLEPCASTSIANSVFPPTPPVYLVEGPKYEVQPILD
jgi:hypothetical protein